MTFINSILVAVLFCGAGMLAATDSYAVESPVSLPGAQGVIPGAQVLFDTIGIRVPSGEQAQFIAGDNIAGYYEGYTHAYRQGVGYRIKTATLFQDHASFVNGVLQDRNRSARSDTIQPYGHRAEYANASEELLLHSGRQALSLRVSSAQPATLSSLPLWSLAAGDYTSERVGPAYLLSPKRLADDGVPRFIALTADQDFHVAPAEPSARATLKLDENILAPLLVSAAPSRQFTVHIAFGFTRQEVLEQARHLAANGSWNAELSTVYRRLTASHLWTSDVEYNRALVWAKASAGSFVVEEFGKGIWAGLPWFRDNWGRDTFISLPGTLLVAGRFDEARAVLENFARYQKLGALSEREYGRIPNRVAAGDRIIYNTVDGTPWMLREALEYLRYSGDINYARVLLPLVREYVKGARTHWVDNEGFLTHDDADTWMDARIAGQHAWSPRGNRAVEIQALWYTALEVGARLSRLDGMLAEADEYEALAARIQANFLKRFWDGQTMADRLHADGKRDTRLRPNQLMLVSIPLSPFVPEAVQAQVTKNAVSALLYPYGIASLAQDHPDFHPRHENPAHHHKDAAYHNGTVWGWNAGFTVTALSKFGYQDLAWPVTQNLAAQILHQGTRGSMSELLDALPDAKAQPHPSGTYAQAWSVAEFARNAYQDYLGFRPDLLNDTLQFVPALPSAWTRLDARLPYGKNEALELRLSKSGETWTWQFLPGAASRRHVQMDLLGADKSRRRVQFRLTGKPQALSWNGHTAKLDGKPLPSTPVMASQVGILGELKPATPRAYLPKEFPVLGGRDVLQNLIIKGEHE